MKAFISYSSNDNNRFVKEFVDRIRDSGIEVWKDNLETINVDLTNIIKEIYKVDIFIVIISKNSIESNWVAEEINVAMKRKIEEDLRIFPIILSEDNIDVPIVLRHLVHYYIDDINNYDVKFKELIDDIFYLSKKSELGYSPVYTKFHTLNNFSKSDSIIIKCLGDAIFDKKYVSFDFDVIQDLVKGYELSTYSVKDSLEILKGNGIIIFNNVASYHPYNIRFTPFGFMFYAQNYISNFDELTKEIIAEIVNGKFSLEVISKETNISGPIVRLYLEYLANNNYIELYTPTNGSYTITNVTASGKHYFKEVLA